MSLFKHQKIECKKLFTNQLPKWINEILPASLTDDILSFKDLIKGECDSSTTY